MKAIQALSIDARLIYERLAKAEVNEVIPYSELSEIIGRNVQHGGRHFLDTARRKALNQNGFVFDAVLDVGIKRLSDEDIVNSVGESGVRRIRRASKRIATKITKVDFAKLPNEEKIAHNAFLSLFGAMAHMAQNRSVAALKGKVEESQEALSLSKTLEFFKG